MLVSSANSELKGRGTTGAQTGEDCGAGDVVLRLLAPQTVDPPHINPLRPPSGMLMRRERERDRWAEIYE